MYLQNPNKAEKIVIENLAKTIQPTRACETPLKQWDLRCGNHQFALLIPTPQMLLS